MILTDKSIRILVDLSVTTEQKMFQFWGFPGGSDSKESTCNVGDLGLIPGLGRSPGEGNSYPLQHSHLENSVDRGAQQVIVHGVTKRQTQLSDFHVTSLMIQYLSLCYLESHISWFSLKCTIFYPLYPCKGYLTSNHNFTLLQDQKEY